MLNTDTERKMETEKRIHKRLAAIIAAEQTQLALGVVYPCDAVSLESALQIHAHRLAKVVLVGPPEAIRSVAKASQLNLSGLEIVATPSDPKAAASIGASCAGRGELAVLMKGSLHTDEFMGAIVSKEAGLRTEARISHVMVCDIPAYHKLLSLTDCVVNIAPDLEQKKHILTNGVRFQISLGCQEPKVGIVTAVETVNPSIPATVDAAALVEFGHSNGFPKSTVAGPFGFDNVISKDSARIKHISSSVCGDPDLILLPDLHSANILYKSLVYLAQTACAGVVVGARIPVVLTSRSESLFSRLASVAVAIRSARHPYSI
jgi:phosphate acetyltransferase